MQAWNPLRGSLLRYATEACSYRSTHDFFELTYIIKTRICTFKLMDTMGPNQRRRVEEDKIALPSANIVSLAASTVVVDWDLLTAQAPGMKLRSAVKRPQLRHEELSRNAGSPCGSSSNRQHPCRNLQITNELSSVRNAHKEPLPYEESTIPQDKSDDKNPKISSLRIAHQVSYQPSFFPHFDEDEDDQGRSPFSRSYAALCEYTFIMGTHVKSMDLEVETKELRAESAGTGRSFRTGDNKCRDSDT